MTEQEQPGDPSQEESSSPGCTEGPDSALLKKAMRAFKKRLKLTKLDEESKLGVGPMSGGKKSAIVAIMPPYGYDKEVWDELVKQGRLKDSGRGFYELGSG